MLVFQSSIRDELKSYYQKIQCYSTKLQNVVMDEQFSKYKDDGLLMSKPNTVIRYYLALSMATLHELSLSCKNKNNSKYDNLMSGHEALVAKILTNEFKLPFVRQLLIGSSHSDFYVPMYHLSIEPSRDRYYSTSARARAEEQSEYQRKLMNELVTLRIENYRSTSKDLRLVIGNYGLRPPLSLLNVKNNIFRMAMHTLPRFIPYKALIQMVAEENETPINNLLH